MKSSLYFNYTTRSLVRGGQRTLLALFCIAVGVMAIVGLELATASMMNAVTSNVRVLNQGDVSLQAGPSPLSQNDLSFFSGLKSKGQISGYTAETADYGAIDTPGGKRLLMQSQVVQAPTFPLVGTPHIIKPSGASIKSLLSRPGAAVVTESLAKKLGIPIGSPFTLNSASYPAAHFTLAGIVKNDNETAQGDLLDVSVANFERATGKQITYTFVAVTTPTSAAASQAATAIRQRFPLTTVRTVSDVLKQNKQNVQTVRRFLIVVGLLALLIGGVGIVNTMQVLLSRRRIEIAILKTSGYRRRDLYALFGLEAAMLGFLGGIAGAILGIGVSDGLRVLFERATGAILPFTLDPLAVISGVAIGVATALIFGLLPIVRASGVRPQAVLRDLPEGRSRGAIFQMLGLIFLLSILFCVLASIILGSALWGIIAVYGAFIFLGLLSLLLTGVLAVLQRLPIPERYSPGYLLLVTAGLIVAAAITAVPSLRGVGILILLFVLVGYVVVLFPRAWKVNMKLSLRNIGRTRGRTTTTLLALFIGVFCVGFVVILAQDLRTGLTASFTKQNPYDLTLTVPQQQASRVEALIGQIHAVKRYRYSYSAAGIVTQVNGQPITSRIPQGQNGPKGAGQQALNLLHGVEGYNLSSGDLPTVAQITAGRNLTAADAATPNVILDSSLHGAPLNLQPGDKLSFSDQQSGKTSTFTVVGFYKLSASGFNINFSGQPIFGSQQLAQSLAGPNPAREYYLQVPTAQASQVQSQIQRAFPNVFVFNFNDLLNLFSQALSSVEVIFTAIAALALVAGVVIVANAVALAMLERRRELGILKAVGYTSGRVLSGVLIENGITAGMGGLLGMVLVAAGVAAFSALVSGHLGVSAVVAILIVLGVVLLTTLTAIAVAWGAVRVRPLEVLRYE